MPTATETYADYRAHADLMDRVAPAVRAHFRDPGAQPAHDARCAAALVIHYGGSLDAALQAALPMREAA